MSWPQLDVRNFGPIKEAIMQVKPLCVLMGRNNTGKSYLACLLYAMGKAISQCSDLSF